MVGKAKLSLAYTLAIRKVEDRNINMNCVLENIVERTLGHKKNKSFYSRWNKIAHWNNDNINKSKA